MGNIHPVILALIGANVLFSMQGFKDFSFFEKYKFNIGGIRRGEQVRILSSGFLHVNWQHLFFNMFTLYFFANNVLVKLGIAKFLLVYFGSLVLGLSLIHI